MKKSIFFALFILYLYGAFFKLHKIFSVTPPLTIRQNLPLWIEEQSLPHFQVNHFQKASRL